MKRRTALAFMGMAASAPGVLRAQGSYPDKPVQILTALSNSGTSDVLARTYAERLGANLGKPFIVINKPGAGGIIATQTVAQAAPDGYTLMLTNSAHTIIPLVQPTLPYDPQKDFTGIAQVANAPTVLCVSETLGVKTLEEFVELARRKPGTINYSSAGLGTTTHLAGAYFASAAGIDLVHVPYKNLSDAALDLFSGRVPVAFPPAFFASSLIKEGKARVLGIASRQPLSTPFSAPSVPAAGINWEYGTWYGFLAPAKTPRAVLQTLMKAFSEASKDPQLNALLNGQGVDTTLLLGDAFDSFMRDEASRLRTLVRTTGMRLS